MIGAQPSFIIPARDGIRLSAKDFVDLYAASPGAWSFTTPVSDIIHALGTSPPSRWWVERDHATNIFTIWKEEIVQ